VTNKDAFLRKFIDSPTIRVRFDTNIFSDGWPTYLQFQVLSKIVEKSGRIDGASTQTQSKLSDRNEHLELLMLDGM
jgi:hypothetical protein